MDACKSNPLEMNVRFTEIHLPRYTRKGEPPKRCKIYEAVAPSQIEKWHITLKAGYTLQKYILKL